MDASPLLTMLGLHFIESAAGARPDFDRIITGQAAMYMKDRPDRQKRFQLYIDNIPTLLTTSHVIGELQGLSTKMNLYENERKRFWSSSMEYLERRGFEEQIITLLSMAGEQSTRAWIGIIGPTDTGLIALAKEHGCRLLTDDRRTLMSRALDQGVDCILMENVIDM
jgi:rRNA-processing protein FCF1